MAGCTFRAACGAVSDLLHGGLVSARLSSPSTRPLRYASMRCFAGLLRFDAKNCQHRRAAFHIIPSFDLDGRRALQKNVHARTELHQSNTLAATHRITDLLREHDTTRQKTSDLLEHKRVAFAFHNNRVLLVQ